MHNLDVPYSDQIIQDEKQYGKCLTMFIRKLIVIELLFVGVAK